MMTLSMVAESRKRGRATAVPIVAADAAVENAHPRPRQSDTRPTRGFAKDGRVVRTMRRAAPRERSGARHLSHEFSERARNTPGRARPGVLLLPLPDLT